MLFETEKHSAYTYNDCYSFGLGVEARSDEFCGSTPTDVNSIIAELDTHDPTIEYGELSVVSLSGLILML
jgi:hypothetical protein